MRGVSPARAAGGPWPSDSRRPNGVPICSYPMKTPHAISWRTSLCHLRPPKPSPLPPLPALQPSSIPTFEPASTIPGRRAAAVPHTPWPPVITVPSNWPAHPVPLGRAPIRVPEHLSVGPASVSHPNVSDSNCVDENVSGHGHQRIPPQRSHLLPPVALARVRIVVAEHATASPPRGMPCKPAGRSTRRKVGATTLRHRTRDACRPIGGTHRPKDPVPPQPVTPVRSTDWQPLRRGQSRRPVGCPSPHARCQPGRARQAAAHCAHSPRAHWTTPIRVPAP